MKVEKVLAQAAGNKTDFLYKFWGKGLLNSANLFTIYTNRKIAGIAGISPDTIAKVSRIADKGTPEQLKRIK